jgi:uncharacterized protein YndB with AHSA1/START domain
LAEFAVEAHIAAPPEKVWDRLNDTSTWSEWSVPHGGFPNGAPAALEVGATFEEGTKLMNHPAQIVWTVERVEPNRCLALDGQAPAGVVVRQQYVLAPDSDGGTCMTMSSSVSGTAVNLMSNKVAQVGRAAFEESLEKFASLLE